jgi:hypothetical protein
MPWCLPGPISSDPIRLWASRIAGAGTVEGSGVHSEANDGDQMHGWNTTEKMEMFSSEAIYYILYKSRAFIDIPGIIVLFSFPQTLCSKKKRNLQNAGQSC